MISFAGLKSCRWKAAQMRWLKWAKICLTPEANWTLKEMMMTKS